LYQLASAMKVVENGDFSTRVNLKSRDETRYLAECFNKMTSNIEILINKVYNAELKQKEAELASLQSQINPHFLYNTLESIRGMAIANNIKSIASMSKSLSIMFRYSINNRTLVPVRNELQHLENYLNIQNFRHKDKFKLILNIPEEIYSCSILKLTLQPIVENSIKHGLEMKLGKGTISINASVCDSILSIRILDDGTGIPAEKLLLLNKSLSNSNAIVMSSGDNISDSGIGIGVRNVNSRIKLFFGERYGLLFHESISGASVEIILPVIEWKELD
jgi:two-component system, sensor histidine kinase YesM